MAAATATASARIPLDFTLFSLTAPDFMNRLDKYSRIPAIRPDGLVSRTRCGILHAAPQSRDRTKRRCLYDPGSAKQRCTLHRARETQLLSNRIRPALFQRAGIGRPGVNALEERHRLGMAVFEP